MNNKEIELKYGVIGDIEDLEASCKQLGIISNLKEDKLANSYFDTVDKDLYKAKAGLRIRKANSYCEQTLKIKSSNLGGLHIRQEYNIAFNRRQSKPNLNAFDKNIFPKDFDIAKINKNLVKLCDINFVRKSVNLEFDNCLFEICYDKGLIQVEDKQLAINEFEVELLEHDDQNINIDNLFYKFSIALNQVNLPLSLEPFSKMHKAALLMNTKDSFDLPVRTSNMQGLDNGIVDAIICFEQMFGLLMFRQDLASLMYFNSACALLLMYLKEYKSFIASARYDTNANIADKRAIIKNIYAALKEFYAYSLKKEQKLRKKDYETSKEKVKDCVMKLRLLICSYHLYNITLKMRYALSLK